MPLTDTQFKAVQSAPLYQAVLQVIRDRPNIPFPDIREATGNPSIGDLRLTLMVLAAEDKVRRHRRHVKLSGVKRHTSVYEINPHPAHGDTDPRELINALTAPAGYVAESPPYIHPIRARALGLPVPASFYRQETY
jgi:hypothetical protein